MTTFDNGAVVAFDRACLFCGRETNEAAFVPISPRKLCDQVCTRFWFTACRKCAREKLPKAERDARIRRVYERLGLALTEN